MGNAPNIPYNIAGNVPSYNDQSGWSLNTGTTKANSDPVSIFKIKLEGLSSSRKEACTNAFNRMKTIRHPNVLKFLDGIESEKEILIVTEPIKPLQDWLNVAREVNSKEQFEAALAWGLRCICNALQFLANDCNLLHGLLSSDAVFVTEGGDWKLGRLDMVASLNKNGPDTVFTYNNELLPQQYRSPERLQRSWTSIADNPIWATDAWSYGCLIYEAFNGKLSRTEQTQNMQNIPGQLRKVLQRLLASNPKQRPNPKRVLKMPFFDRDLVQTLSFLDEIAVKEPDDKRTFFQQLPSKLNAIPAHVCIHKILPALKNSMAILPAASLVVPMLGIGKMIGVEDLDTYSTCVMPTLIEFYKMNDRGVRALLLQNIDSYKHALEYKKNGKGENILNKEIFKCMITGFRDSAPQMREITLKTIPTIVDMLNAKNLNTTLGNVLKNLLSDPVPGIRVNATILLGLLAEKFDTATRNRLLLPGFTQALSDPFYHNRAVALKALGTTHRMYDVKDACSKILPHIVCRLVDDVHAVRQPAFACLAQFVKRLEVVSEEMAVVEAEQKKEEEKKRIEDEKLAKEQEKVDKTTKLHNKNGGTYGGTATASIGTKATANNSTDIDWGDDEDDDFFSGINSSKTSSKLKPKNVRVSKLDLKRINKKNNKQSGIKTAVQTKSKGGDEDFFGSGFGTKNRTSSKGSSFRKDSKDENVDDISNNTWGDDDDDLFGDMMMSTSSSSKKSTKKKTPPPEGSSLLTSHRSSTSNNKKKTPEKSTISFDSWGNDDDDLFGSSPSPPKVKKKKQLTPPAKKLSVSKTKNTSSMLTNDNGWGDNSDGDDPFSDLLSETSIKTKETKKKASGRLKLKTKSKETTKAKISTKSRIYNKKSSNSATAKNKSSLGDKDDFFGDFGF
jgi:SCY1-like protein 1